MKKQIKVISLVLIAVLMLTLCACGGSGSAAANTPAPGNEGTGKQSNSDETNASTNGDETVDPIVINLVSTFPAGNVNYEAAVLLADQVNELTDGQIQFNFLGGSEIFSGSAGAEAVMSGALDAVFTAADYFTGFAPEAAAICASNMTYAEMTASGGLDYINSVFAANDVRLLYVVDEVGISGTQIFVNEAISSLEDLKGKSIRSTGTVQGDVLASIGCSATPLGLSDIFSALEQGLVQGYCGPAYLGGAMGFFEYCKCVVSTEIARGGSSLLINEDVWESIPEDLQVLLMESLTQVNEAEIELYKQYVDDNQSTLIEAGGQIVELSAEDDAALKEICEEYSWKSVEDTVDAEVYATLREMFMK